LLFLSLIGAGPALPASTNQPSPFTIVFIDAKTETLLGRFPYDRAVMAMAVEASAKLGAKCVVLKFFFDLPKSADGDAALVQAMRKTPILLEAHADDSQAAPNPLPDRFFLRDLRGDSQRTIGGRSGWIPLPQFAAVAADVGFVDAADFDHVPIIESYRGAFVKSLWLCGIEKATGEAAQIEPGRQLKMGNRSVKLSADNQLAVSYPAADHLNSISFCDLLSGTVDAEKIKGRMVIIGYDGDQGGRVKTPLGEMRRHRAFCYMLFSVYAQMR
jgi:adenylate cyclase